MILILNIYTGIVIDMLSIYETYCDLCDLTLGNRMFLSDGSEPGETRPANGRMLDGTVIMEMVYLGRNTLINKFLNVFSLKGKRGHSKNDHRTRSYIKGKQL